MRRIFLVVFCCVAFALSVTGVASADDGDPRFRRTTPRGSFGQTDGALVVGVPGGRAWGIESDLRSLPPAGTSLVVRLAVTDAGVREAFVRVAYYGSGSGRTRQLAISDSEPVPSRSVRTVAVPLEPPPGAVAYRVRVLARLADPSARSADDAVRADLHVALGAARPFGSLASRLLE